LHLVGIIVAIFVLIAGYGLIFKALSEQFELQHEINAGLPASAKFEPVFWSFGTWARFRELQRELLPGNTRFEKCRTFTAVGIVLLLSGLLILAASFKGTIR
jgi:hypothetical protein